METQRTTLTRFKAGELQLADVQRALNGGGGTDVENPDGSSNNPGGTFTTTSVDDTSSETPTETVTQGDPNAGQTGADQANGNGTPPVNGENGGGGNHNNGHSGNPVIDRMDNDLGRWAGKHNVPAPAPIADDPENTPPLEDWANAGVQLTRYTGQTIQDEADAGRPIDSLIDAELHDLQDLNQGIENMTNAIAGYTDTLFDALPGISQALGVPLNDDFEAASGIDDSGFDADFAGEMDAKTEAAVAEADRLADELILAPKPETDGDKLMSELIQHFLETIRDLDLKSRQIVLARLAKQMMDNLITTFYKERKLENDRHHNDSLTKMHQDTSEQIDANTRNSMVAGSNNPIPMSGQVSSATLSEAMNVSSMRQDFVRNLDRLEQDQPPKITRMQKRQLMSQFDAIVIAGGSGVKAGDATGLEDDRLAALSLAGSVNRFRPD